MFELIKKFFTLENYARRAMSVTGAVVAVELAAGTIPIPEEYKWVARVLAVAAGGLTGGSGETPKSGIPAPPAPRR